MDLLTKPRAELIMGAIKDRRIVVLGDCMLDEVLWGDVTRISPEAPVPVVDVRNQTAHLGGAANVLANMVALGACPCVVGVVGSDVNGDRLRTAVTNASPAQPDDYLIVDEGRPSTVKTRIIAHNQLVVRFDRERRTPINGEIEDRIITVLQDALPEADALVVSDYDKGTVTARI